jgi:hypothetical protein
MSLGRNMIRKDGDVAHLTEFELSKRIEVRERQSRRLEKELKILRRVHMSKKTAGDFHASNFPTPLHPVYRGRGI